MKRNDIIQRLNAFATGTTSDIAPETKEALLAAAALLESDGKLPAVRRRDHLPSAGAPWSQEEDARLNAEFDAGMTIAQIALQHGRTSGAITARLVRLGRIEPTAVRSRERGARLAS